MLSPFHSGLIDYIAFFFFGAVDVHDQSVPRDFCIRSQITQICPFDRRSTTAMAALEAAQKQWQEVQKRPLPLLHPKV
jgi:hypothetical protein